MDGVREPRKQPGRADVRAHGGVDMQAINPLMEPPAARIPNQSVLVATDKTSDIGPCWYAVYARSRHEKRIKQQLEAEFLQCFLPLYQAVHRWKDRRTLVSLPLFPGYLFVRIPLADRMRVLRTPGVVNLVSTHGGPTPIPDHEVEGLRICVTRQIKLAPHPYLAIGRRVHVWRGPFAEMEGILLRTKGGSRLVLSINLIARSVAVEVDANDVFPAIGYVQATA
jgi:transcription elongation factor/antiterminator RfaH